MPRALYIDDTVDTCDCCGKTDLKKTVAIRLDDGAIVHYGTTCAARNTGKDQRQIKREIFDEQARQLNRQRKMAACAEAWKAWENYDFNSEALQIQRRNYHLTGGQGVNGNFPDWLRSRALGLE